MKLPKVDNFLGCFELRTGGLVIASFLAAFSVLSFPIGIFLSLVIFLYDCKDRAEYGPVIESLLSKCDPFRIVWVPVGIIIVLLSIGLFVCSFFCIRGILQRNHSYVRPMTAAIGVITVLSFLQIFSMDVALIVSGLVTTLLYAYLFIVMYSIHSQFESEFMNTGFTTQYQPSILKD